MSDLKEWYVIYYLFIYIFKILLYYAINFEQSDLKCLTSTKAPTTVYRDHLPLLGQHFHQVLHRNEQQNQGAHNLNDQDNQMHIRQLEIGDLVLMLNLFFVLISYF